MACNDKRFHIDERQIFPGYVLALNRQPSFMLSKHSTWHGMEKPNPNQVLAELGSEQDMDDV
jgi:hypothetical protein